MVKVFAHISRFNREEYSITDCYIVRSHALFEGAFEYAESLKVKQVLVETGGQKEKMVKIWIMLNSNSRVP